MVEEDANKDRRTETRQSYKTEENVLFFSTGSAIMIFNNSIKNPNTEILITLVMHTEQPSLSVSNGIHLF